MTQSDAKRIAVFGGYQQEVGGELYRLAEKLGECVARRGWTLLNGGYAGSMEASARGARNAGGHTIGVTCAVFKREPNEFIAETIPTPDLWARLRVMLERGDGYIALPGATGTLAEVAMVWEFLVKGFMPRRPMALLGEFWRPLYDMLVPRPDVRAAADGLVRVVQTPEEAVAFMDRTPND